MKLLRKMLGLDASNIEKPENESAKKEFTNDTHVGDSTPSGQTPSVKNDMEMAARAGARGSQTNRRGKTQYERFQGRIKEAEERERRVKETKRLRLAKREKAKKGRAALFSKRVKIIQQHLEPLKMKRLQCLNTWGRLEGQQWTTVKIDFIRSVLRAAKSETRFWSKDIDRRVGRLSADVLKPRKSSVAHGADFELQMAARLRSLGWTVQLLGQSGDQGGDLLAQKNEKSIVIQCKNYLSRVSNAAVQEAFTAKQFYGASVAVVVAPAGFTRQAKTLADKTGVVLCSPDNLSSLG